MVCNLWSLIMFTASRYPHFFIKRNKATNKIDCYRFKSISLKNFIFGENSARLETSILFNRIIRLTTIFNVELYTWDSFKAISNVWRKIEYFQFEWDSNPKARFIKSNSTIWDKSHIWAGIYSWVWNKTFYVPGWELWLRWRFFRYTAILILANPWFFHLMTW